MAINFPTSLDTLTNPTTTSPLNSPSHAGQHSDANDALEALEAKVGANSSAVTTSHDYKIAQLESGKEDTLGFTPENSANKENTTLDTSTTKYPCNNVVKTAVDVKASLTGTETLTNKRITPRVTSETSSATPTINTDNTDVYRITALATNITSMTTNLSGTPTHGQKLIIEITGTAARAITWGASFEASTVALPTTTVTTAMLSVGFIYNSATSKWRCLASA